MIPHDFVRFIDKVNCHVVAFIAEVCYNFALTCITQENCKLAEESLQIAIQTVDKLHLNSLRVCNVAKLYAIQALLSVLQAYPSD